MSLLTRRPRRSSRIGPASGFGFRPVPEPLEGRPLLTLTYHGGPFIQNVEAETVYLGPAWTNDSTLLNQSQQIDNFFKFLTDSSYMDLLKEYGSGALAIGHGSFSDHDYNPHVPTNGSTIGDAEIQGVLAADIAQGFAQPPSANHLYVVFVEPNVTVTRNGQSSAQDFLGYHGTFNDPGHGTVNYIVVPYPGAPNMTVPGLAATSQLTAVASRELANAVTDPDGQTGWINDGTLPGTRGAEVGDIYSTALTTLGNARVQVLYSNLKNGPVPATTGTAETPGDYDGDGKTDLATFDANTSTLYVIPSGGGAPLIQQFGDPSHQNVPVTGDYDGDGKTDLGIYDRTTATFYVIPSGGGAPLIQQFGNPAHTNIPVTGDYNGDGKTDIGLFDVTTSTLYVIPSGGGSPLIRQFGDPSHKNFPVAGDYDGDGKTDIGIYDQTAATFYILPSGGGAPIVQQIGTPGHFNVPVVGTYSSDGKADLGVYDQTTATFFVKLNTSGVIVQQLGLALHRIVPIVADYSRAGTTDLAIYDQSNSTFYVIPSGGGSPRTQQFGNTAHNNLPVPSQGIYSGLSPIILSVPIPSNPALVATVIPDASSTSTATTTPSLRTVARRQTLS